MNQYLSSNSLKSLAKGQLLGKYGTVVGVTVLQALCILPLRYAISYIIDGNTLPGVFLQTTAWFLLCLFGGYLIAGRTYMYLKIACSQTPYIKDLFHFFKGDSSKVLYIQAVRSAIFLLCTLPFQIVGHYVNLSMANLDYTTLTLENFPVSAPLYLLYMALGVLGIGVSLYCDFLLLFPAFYLMLDFPEYTAPQLLKMSIQLMKGNKARKLYLSLSFVPLYLLSSFSCGIALLWIMPYKGATNANFYLDLIKKKNQGL